MPPQETPDTPETLRQYVTRRTDELLATLGRPKVAALAVGIATGHHLFRRALEEMPEVVDNPQARNAVRLVAAERILEWYTTLATIAVERMFQEIDSDGAALDRKADEDGAPGQA